MPKRLYFALSLEKQTNIYEAALQEFSEQPYDQASINQVIQRASISRGSFYLYFADKEDLYFSILDRILGKTMDEFVQDCTHMEQPELFALYRMTFRSFLKVLDQPEYHLFFTRLYQNMNYRINIKMVEWMEHQRSRFVLANRQIAKDEWNAIIEIVAILSLVNRDLLERKVAEKLSNDRVMELYDLRVSLIRKGFPQTVTLINVPQSKL